ncbi:response regulator [bacterium]|nr:response regulator [bacterium]MBU1152857.1 response regulator [bacterium]MBU1782259.1 response regulator [bacterium]MBU2600193.1 response regulator [bacterium]
MDNLDKELKIKHKVLIVENDPDIIAVILISIEGYNFLSQVASSYSKALVGLSNFQPDVILLDAMANNALNTFKLCREIRLNPQFSQIPLILLSARGQRAEIEKIHKIKVDLYIDAPFNPEELPKSMISFLEKKRT